MQIKEKLRSDAGLSNEDTDSVVFSTVAEAPLYHSLCIVIKEERERDRERYRERQRERERLYWAWRDGIHMVVHNSL